MNRLQKTLLGLARQGISLMFTAIAAFAVWHLYSYHVRAPQTRDGKIRADVVALGSEVSGRVARVDVHDNQKVERGQLLFELDADRLANAVAHAEANLASARARWQAARREAARYRTLSGLAAQQDIDDRANQAALAEAAYRQALAELALARLDLRSAAVRSPVNGVVSNLTLRPGTYARAGEPLVSIVDSDSFHVAGYFEETKLARIAPGAEAIVHVMGEPVELKGHVSGIAPGIEDRERSTAGGTLLANVNPTFSWVRLAQRVPVRVAIDRLPEGMRLVSGMTATVVLEPPRS